MKVAPALAAALVIFIALPGPIQGRNKKSKFCKGADGDRYEKGESYEDKEACIRYTCIKKGNKLKMKEEKIQCSGPENNVNVTALEMKVESLTATVESLLALVTKQGTCMSDFSSSDCPATTPGKISLVDRISSNTDGISNNKGDINVNKADVSSNKAGIVSNTATYSSIQAATTNLETCLGDVNSVKCPSSKDGKTSVSDAIMKNKEDNQIHHTDTASTTTATTTITGIKPRQENIADLGYQPECGAGWYDIQGQGVKNDYCRWVGDCGCRNERGGDCSWWSCALAGSNEPNSPKGEYTEPSIEPKATVESSTDYDHRYRASLLLENACEGLNPSNYWLSPDWKTGEEAYVILNLGRVTQFNRFQIKNTHNGESNDRGAKNVGLYTSNSKDGPWNLVAEKIITDARNKGCNVPIEEVTIATTNSQFVKLVINSYYGYGGGLKYLGVDLVSVPELSGYCLDSEGQYQNTGTTSLTATSKDDCYLQCKAVPLATGCFYQTKSGSCIYHTQSVVSGSDFPGYICWPFPELTGYCLDSEGTDQNTGTTSLTATSKNDCYLQCKAVPLATGCEYSTFSGTCIYHTQSVESGSGSGGYICWPFPVPELTGYCLDSEGNDQNTGTTFIDFMVPKDDCYRRCKAVPLATGCEYTEKSGSCISHTQSVASGSGSGEYICWPFPVQSSSSGHGL